MSSSSYNSRTPPPSPKYTLANPSLNVAANTEDIDQNIKTFLLRCENNSETVNDEELQNNFFLFCEKYKRTNALAAVFDIFKSKGVDLDLPNQNQDRPLHLVLTNPNTKNQREIFELLLTHGAKPNLANGKGETPLHIAAALESDEIIRLLTHHPDSDLLALDLKGQSAAQIIQKGKNIKLIQYLLKATDITQIMNNIGYPQYAVLFIKEELFREHLHDLTSDMLQSLGIVETEHQTKIIQSAKKTLRDLVPTKSESMEFQETLNKMKHIRKDKNWILENSKLNCGKLLGTGTCGTVYQGTYNYQEVAIKCFESPDYTAEMGGFKQEFQIMSSLASPFLVTFFGAILDPKLCMVMELCSRGSLLNVLCVEDIDFSWHHMFRCAIDITKGLLYLHEHTPQVVHRDLKSANVLVTTDFRIKLGDFGLSRFNTDTYKETLMKTRGTYVYLCPRVYSGKGFSAPSDVYSLSIIFWELVHRCLHSHYLRPFAEYPHLKSAIQILFHAATNGLRPTIPKNTPTALATLIETCWIADADKRPDARSILQTLEDQKISFLKNEKQWQELISPNCSCIKEKDSPKNSTDQLIKQ